MLRVEIHIQNRIDPEWTEWLGGLGIHHHAAGGSLLQGTLADQAALYGVLSHLGRLGVGLQSVSCTADLASWPEAPCHDQERQA